MAKDGLHVLEVIMKIPVCPECGSDDIVADAYAAWNPETREWELRGTYDSYICDTCGYEMKECTWKEVEQ